MLFVILCVVNVMRNEVKFCINCIRNSLKDEDEVTILCGLKPVKFDRHQKLNKTDEFMAAVSFIPFERFSKATNILTAVKDDIFYQTYLT